MTARLLLSDPGLESRSELGFLREVLVGYRPENEHQAENRRACSNSWSATSSPWSALA